MQTRLRRIQSNGFRHRRQDTPLSMWQEWHQPNDFTVMIDRAIAAQREPYLAFAINSCYPVEPPILPRIERCLEALVNHPESARFVFCRPGEALAILGEGRRGSAHAAA
jgi:hypothetical protein